MRLVLLGPGGQLGSDIQRANEKRDHPFDIQLLPRDALDVTNAAQVIQTLKGYKFDALINCSSYHKTDEVEANGGLAMATNAHAPRALARACHAAGARLIHISTDYVFGGGPERSPLDEQTAAAPVNVYGASKLLGENLAFAEHDDVLVLRVASLFGVRGASGKGGNFVETMLRLGREKGHLKVVDDQIMSPTATADIANWIMTLLDARADAGLYHAVNSGAVSWADFAAAILQMAEVKADITPIASTEFPAIAMRPPYSALDNTKLTAVTGPIRDWRTALADYLKAKGHTA